MSDERTRILMLMQAQARAKQQSAPQAAPQPAGGVPEGMTFDPISGQYRDPDMRARAHPVSVGQGMMRSAQQGMFGIGDEVNAGLAAAADTKDWQGNPLSFGDAYTSRLEDERAILGQFREDHPVAAYGSEIAMAAALPAGAIKGATTGQRMVSAGRAGGAMGAAYGFGAGEDGAASRARSAGVGAAAGTAGGMAVPFALGGVTGALNRRATGKAVREAAEAAPEPSALRQEARALYKGMEQRGVQFEEDASVRLLGGLVEDLQGFDSDVAPITMRKVGLLANKAQHGLSLEGLMNTREVLGKVAINRTSDGAAASAALKRIDDFMGSLMESDAAGDVAGLADDWKQARVLWKRFKNSERLAESIDRAKDSASGYENGLRVEFRKLRNNKKAWAALSNEEKRVVLEVTRGSVVGNFLRRFAGWGGGEGQQRNLLNMSAGMALGYGAGRAVAGEVGGLAGAGAVMGAGKLAARGAEASTDAAAQRALNFVSNGGRFVQPEPLMLPRTENALSAFGRGVAPIAGVSLTSR